MNTEQGLRDPLTGAYTRLLLQEQLQRELETAERFGLPLSILLLDLDHFKSINDAFGHTRGDGVLQEFVQRVAAIVRASDLIFRYGGDEFVILLTQIGKQQATSLAQRLLDGISGTPFQGEPPLSLSFSVGVACYPLDGQTAEALFEVADQRQYQAKRLGRGRVVSMAAETPRLAPIEDVGRLVERDAAIDAARRFLDALPKHRWGVCSVNGQQGAGKTRFLSEVRKIARLQGYAVLTLQGKPALKDRVYGALVEACQEWKDLPYPLDGESELIDAIERLVAENDSVGLLVTLDQWTDIDRDTLDFLRNLFLSNAFARIGLVYSSDVGQPGWPQEAPLRTTILLEPITQNGAHIWLRQSLQWEPPENFLRWFYSQTGGLPADIWRGLTTLIDNDVLRQVNGHWVLRPEFFSYLLKDELAKLPITQALTLPVYQTEFVGRESELRAIKRLIREHRMLVVVGSPGVGKTRLASQAAAECAETFQGGVCFVPPVALTQPDYLVYAVAEALHLSLSGSQDPKTQLFNYLGSNRRSILLILDGCENLPSGFGLLLELLERAPSLHLLITSTRHLGLGAGVSFELHGLAFPEAENAERLEDYVSMQLFVRVARRTNLNFSLSAVDRPAAARICRLVGGIPLLIELAAGWVRAYSCHEIAQQIERNLDFLSTDQPEVPERHRSLVAVFDSLWELLSESEQRSLRYLSIFRGGFSEEAASQVATASPFFLDALLAKSYLRQAPGGRYMLHELLRQYVAEKLRALPVEKARAQERHCTYFTHYVSSRTAVLRSERRAQEEISVEMENVRAAWNWGVSQGRLKDLERCQPGLSRFYDNAGWYQEAESVYAATVTRLRSNSAGVQRFKNVRRLLGLLLAEQACFLDRRADYGRGLEVAQASLDLIESDEDVFAAAAHLQYGRALRGLGRYPQAQEHLEVALMLSRSRRQPHVITWSLTEMAEICLSQGRYSEALKFSQEALDIYRKIQDRRGEGQAANFLGLISKNRGRYAEAEAYLKTALQIFREIGERRGEGQALNNLGLVHTNLCDYPSARFYYEQALPIYREIGDRVGESWGLNSIGFVHHLHGEYDAAREYFLQALSVCQHTGDRWGESVSLYNLGGVMLDLGLYDDAEDLLRKAMQICLDLGDRWGLAWRLSQFGWYCCLRGQFDCALNHCQQALEYAEEVGDLPVQGKTLICLGHAQVSLGQPEAARLSYQRALELRRTLNETILTVDPLAGLADLALAQNDLPSALRLVEQIAPHLSSNLAGADHPFWVFWVCYRVLQAAADSQAPIVLELAYTLIQSRAERIADPVTRRQFLENIALHRQLLAEWESQKNTAE